MRQPSIKKTIYLTIITTNINTENKTRHVDIKTFCNKLAIIEANNGMIISVD